MKLRVSFANVRKAAGRPQIPDDIEVLFLDFDGVINTYRGALDYFGFSDRRDDTSFRRILYKVAYWLPEGKWRNRTFEFFWRWMSHDEGFDKYSFYLLRELLKQRPRLYIVISSVWKSDGIEHNRRLLARHGIEPHRVLSSNPSVNSYRGKEIKAWLEGLERNPKLPWREDLPEGEPVNTPHRYHLKVSSFAIVDDDSDMEPFMDRFVHTDSHDGFSYRDYCKVSEILSRPYRYDTTQKA